MILLEIILHCIGYRIRMIMLDTVLVGTCFQTPPRAPPSLSPPSPPSPSPPPSPSIGPSPCYLSPDLVIGSGNVPSSHYCGLARTTFDAILRRFSVCGDLK